jgi:uncharacterized membrane protein
MIYSIIDNNLENKNKHYIELKKNLKKNKENRILYFNEIKENKDLFNKWINIIYSLMYLLESNNYYHNKLNWMC